MHSCGCGCAHVLLHGDSALKLSAWSFYFGIFLKLSAWSVCFDVFLWKAALIVRRRLCDRHVGALLFW